MNDSNSVKATYRRARIKWWPALRCIVDISLVVLCAIGLVKHYHSDAWPLWLAAIGYFVNEFGSDTRKALGDDE